MSLLMYHSVRFVRPALVWLAAAMLPFQPALVLAGCCSEPGNIGETETEHGRCCGDVAHSSLPAKCDCGPGCHCRCQQNEDRPVAATTVPTTSDRTDSEFSQAVPAAGADAHRSNMTAQRGGLCPATAALTSAQRCVSLSKLQL
jgi:hypothetical protein